ncbi:MAG: hypothetical protein II897_04055 [Clostridia bacterium]|nr:hypothetical protein [Clostridia bacterium]
MTIREWLIENEARIQSERLSKLVEIGAPAVMLNAQRKLVEELDNGIVEVGGETALLETEIETYEWKTGKGGKPYAHINGSVNFFPRAKYGRYIARA